MAAVVLRHCEAYREDLLDAAIEDLVAPFEEKLLGQGAKVLLKPNMVKALPRERRGTTDPFFVEAVIRWGKARGWDMAVADSPALGSMAQVARANGLDGVCSRHDVKLLQLKGDLPRSREGRPVHLSRTLEAFDGVVNLPKLKGHGQLYFTAAIKNLFGCISGKRKVWLHMKHGDKEGGDRFAQMLLDHALEVKAMLHLVDGVEVMAGRGPISGEPVHEGLLAASHDPIALDLALFRHLGGDLEKDPILSLLKGRGDLVEPELLLPQGKPQRGDFYFPGDEQRKPISFHPLVLLRYAWRNLATSLKRA